VPGVLSARFLEKGLRFGLGSTLAFRRRDLEAIGGFEALLDYLADDYELAAASPPPESELNSAPPSSAPFCPLTRCVSFSAIKCAGRGPFAPPGAGDTQD